METLIFDCDGVLVDSEVIAEATLLAQLQHWLPDLELETELSQSLGMTTDNILKHLQHLSTHDLPSDALLRIDQAIEARLADELQAVHGVAEAVSRLNLPLAIVSNSSRYRVRNSLATTELHLLLGSVPLFTAEQVEHPKPDPAVYHFAARQLKCTPQDCLVVEDSVSGVTAATAAGMTVIGFTGASHIEPGHDQRLVDAGAWRILPSMSGLQELVAIWRQSRAAKQPQ